MKKLFTILMLLIVWLNGYPTNYYVNLSGNDANAGTIGSPWRSTNKVNSVTFASGDHISFNGGDIFYGFINARFAGVTYGSYGTGKATITGFTNVAAWTNLGGNIWESSAAVSTLSTCNMVVINGSNVAMGRTPNTGYYMASAATGTTSITSPSLTGTPNWTGAEVVIRKIAWITDRNMITSQTGGTLNYTSATTYPGQVGWGFFIQNDARTLDVQNEWYYSPTTKKIRIYSTTMPGTAQISTIDTLFKNTNKSNVVIDGLKFTGSNTMTFQVSAMNQTVQNSDMDFAGRDCFWGAQGIAPVSTGLIFQHNTINHTNNDALVIRDRFSGSFVQYNTIRNTGMQEGMMLKGPEGNGYGDAIQIRADNVMVQYNYVIGCGYAGINAYMSDDIIQYNFVDSAMQTLADGGAIYTWIGPGNSAGQKTGCKALHNIVLNSRGNNAGTPFTTNNPAGMTQGEGIYLDDLAANWEIAWNTVYNSGFSNLFMHNTKNINVHDNTFFNSGRVVTYNSVDATDPVRLTTFKNNKVIAQNANQFTVHAVSRVSDITQFGSSATIDSNYYARPIAETLPVGVQVGTGNTTVSSSYNNAQWNTYSAFDAHTVKSPVLIMNIAQFFFAYNATDHDSTVTIPAGTWRDVKNVLFTTSTVIHSFESVVLMSTGMLITPTITWANPAAITYLTAISGTQLNATTGVSGTFSYSIGGTPLHIGDVLPAGTYTVTVLFTPSDPATYTSNTKSVTLVVNPFPATITVFGTSVPYTGSPLLPSVSTSPSGLPYSITLNGTTGGRINAGTYSYVAGITDPNYSATTKAGFFTITKALDTILATGKTVNYDGNVQTITATTTKGLGAFLTYTYNGGAPSSTTGVYQVIINENETNHQAIPDTVTLTIVNNSAIIFISDTLATFDSLPHTVTVTSPYSFILTGVPQTNAGVYTNVIATISDGGLHTGADTATLTIQKRQAILSWPVIAPIPYGAQLTSLILNATADVAGHFNYSLPLGTIPGVGVTGMIATFIPDDSANILGGTISNTVSVYGVNPFLNFYIIGPGGVIYIKQ